MPHARTAKPKPVTRTRSPGFIGLFRVVQDARNTTVRSRSRCERNDDDDPCHEAERHRESK